MAPTYGLATTLLPGFLGLQIERREGDLLNAMRLNLGAGAPLGSSSTPRGRQQVHLSPPGDSTS